MVETNWSENYATRVSSVFFKITLVDVKMSDPDISIYFIPSSESSAYLKQKNCLQ